jgi:hypothetical protein
VIDLYSTTPISDTLFPNRGPLHFLVGAEEDLIVRALSGQLREGEELAMVLPGAPQARRGLLTAERFFGELSFDEAFEALSRKFGPPRSVRPGAATFYNEQTQRSFNLHHEPGHYGGLPHVDIRRRGGYPDRVYPLRE